MRTDEKFAIDALGKFLDSKRPFIFLEGSDPPDCFALSGFQRIGIEITRIGPMDITSEGKILKRESEVPISKWIESVKPEVYKVVPDDSVLLCHIQAPIEDFPAFKRKFVKEIKSLIEAGKIDVATKRHQIGSAVVELSLRPRRKGGFPTLFTTGSSMDNLLAQMSLDLQSGGSVATALQDKEHKCRKYKERVWLVLINTHLLLNRSDFESLDRRIFIKHSFEKIFVVDPQGTVFCVFEKASSPMRYVRSFFGWWRKKFNDHISERILKGNPHE